MKVITNSDTLHCVFSLVRPGVVFSNGEKNYMKIHVDATYTNSLDTADQRICNAVNLEDGMPVHFVSNQVVTVHPAAALHLRPKRKRKKED